MAVPLARIPARGGLRNPNHAHANRGRAKAGIGDFQSRRFPLALAAQPHLSCQRCHHVYDGQRAQQSGQSLAGQAGAYSGHQISYQRQARHGGYPYSAPYQSHLWQSGNQHRHFDTSQLVCCACVVTARPSQSRTRHVDGAQFQQAHIHQPQKRQRWQSGVAGVSPCAHQNRSSATGAGAFQYGHREAIV